MLMSLMLSVTCKPYILSVTCKLYMLSVTCKPYMLSVIMLDVIMPSVVAPPELLREKIGAQHFCMTSNKPPKIEF